MLPDYYSLNGDEYRGNDDIIVIIDKGNQSRMIPS